jgi:hypothetical protein
VLLLLAGFHFQQDSLIGASKHLYCVLVGSSGGSLEEDVDGASESTG